MHVLHSLLVNDDLGTLRLDGAARPAPSIMGRPTQLITIHSLRDARTTGRRRSSILGVLYSCCHLAHVTHVTHFLHAFYGLCKPAMAPLLLVCAALCVRNKVAKSALVCLCVYVQN
jgi:hypothetical protein